MQGNRQKWIFKTENPCVAGSIPVLAKKKYKPQNGSFEAFFGQKKRRAVFKESK
jgi:hypothetical protein